MANIPTVDILLACNHIINILCKIGQPEQHLVQLCLYTILLANITPTDQQGEVERSKVDDHTETSDHDEGEHAPYPPVAPARVLGGEEGGNTP